MVKELRESFAFTTTVNAGETKTLTKRIEEDGKIKRVKLQIPDGPDGDFKVYPFFTDSKGVPKEMVNFVGDQRYLAGNNIDIDLFTDTPIERYSTINVVATNDGSYPYPLQLFIEVEYIIVTGGAR